MNRIRRTFAKLRGLILSGCYGCGGAADPFFLCWKENWGGGCELCRRGWAWRAAVDCGARFVLRAAWIVSAWVGVGARR